MGFFKKLIRHPIKTTTAPIREVVKHVPVVGHTADKALRETARVVDNVAHVANEIVRDAVDTVSGKSKIKEQADLQIEQCRAEFANLKSNSLMELENVYQENLIEIQLVIQNMENEKNRLLANKTEDLEELNIEEIRGLEADLVIAQQAIQAIAMERENGIQIMETIERQHQEQLRGFVAEVTARYEPLLQRCEHDLNINKQHEQEISLEYNKQRVFIANQYDAKLNEIVRQIEEQKKKACKRVTRNFAISVASMAVAKVAAPKLASALSINNKVGAVMIHAATASTVNAIATNQTKQLPAALLGNVVTSGLITASMVDKFVDKSVLGKLTIENQALKEGLRRAIVGGMEAVAVGENIAATGVGRGLHAYATSVAASGIQAILGSSIASSSNDQDVISSREALRPRP